MVSFLTDVDECLLGTDNCDENAECKDTNGSYECECKNGFIGNGTICNGKFAVLSITIESG